MIALRSMQPEMGFCTTFCATAYFRNTFNRKGEKKHIAHSDPFEDSLDVILRGFSDGEALRTERLMVFLEEHSMAIYCIGTHFPRSISVKLNNMCRVHCRQEHQELTLGFAYHLC